jgi:hypothetical protein
METLLERLTPEFKTKLDSLDLETKEIVTNILVSEKYFVELKLRECYQLMLLLDLGSLDKVISLFK